MNNTLRIADIGQCNFRLNITPIYAVLIVCADALNLMLISTFGTNTKFTQPSDETLLQLLRQMAAKWVDTP